MTQRDRRIVEARDRLIVEHPGRRPIDPDNSVRASVAAARQFRDVIELTAGARDRHAVAAQVVLLGEALP